MSCLGFDTSNYTTSAAWYDGAAGVHVERLLPVKPGALGLRQSDALFHHVSQLPEVFSQLAEGMPTPAAVGASTRPRAVVGSYMPCFLAGASQGRVLARALGVPFYAFSHQQGHFAAALWGAGRMDLLEAPLLAWHLSGGTTELLHLSGGPGLSAEKIGGTTDLSAGQLIDRTGGRLGLPFPSGKALDALAQTGSCTPFPIRVENSRFSLSGMENQVEALLQRGADSREVSAFCVKSLCRAVKTATAQARTVYGALPVLFSGGVASNSALRREMAEENAIFADPVYSTDNAMGIAVLTHLAKEGLWNS